MKKSLVTFVLALAAFAVAQDATPQQPVPTASARPEIKDPAEYNAYMSALQQQDNAAKVSGFEAFLQQYPNSVMKEQSLEQWQQIMDLNLTSTFLCMKVIGGAMVSRGQGGRVINVASISGMIANRGIGGRSYETSKAAVIQLTRAAAADWAPHQVTVNAICPGGFMTAPNVRWAKDNPEVISRFREQIPQGDFGKPEDLGPLAVYLASDASRYVTGAALVIDGGYTLW